ncbi:MAG: carbamoyltransferase HypF [Desulfuromonadales bacterium]
MLRKTVSIEGIVQGVGFRPFVFHLAQKHGLSGWVRNDSRGVSIEVEGETIRVERFLDSLPKEMPPLASISRLESTDTPLRGEKGFVILESEEGTEKKAQIAPDSWVCPDCLGELFEPENRRYRYPFINCTNCGPRFSIVTAIPYDRPNTTMTDFPMCPDCRREYEDPSCRRFHAQPNACPVCGPQVCLLDGDGQPIGGEDSVDETVRLLKQGRIVAVKGLGGYHLSVDAENGTAVDELRRRKARDEKPFALMSPDLDQVADYTRFDDLERRLLTSTERPIVLLRRKPDHPLSDLVAPNNRYFGVMLPGTPLHHLLLRDNFRALVMTSANLSDEPIAFEDDDARRRLAGIADAFLLHDRRIHMRTDDSIARIIAEEAVVMRRSRGYVPRSIFLPAAQPPVLGVGAELKNTVCLTRDDRACLSQHIGDLKNPETCSSFGHSIDHLKNILDIEPEAVAHDLHPDYESSRYAGSLTGVRTIAVQHHHAHLASCLAEHGLDRRVIGIICDGTGYGTDGKIWGGEFLVGDLRAYRRVGQLAEVPMPGGDAAVREPRRMALSYLVAAYGTELPSVPLLERFSGYELKLLLQMISKGLNSPSTSSCGRLFDGIAALVGIRDKVSYDGQAALELEMAIGECDERSAYAFDLEDKEGRAVLGYRGLIRAVVGDVVAGVEAARISARFHNALAEASLSMCCRIRQTEGVDEVVLSGGVFQNRYLTERTVELLRQADFQVYTHSLVPPNDGGLSFGQAAVAGAQLRAGG